MYGRIHGGGPVKALLIRVSEMRGSSTLIMLSEYNNDDWTTGFFDRKASARRKFKFGNYKTCLSFKHVFKSSTHITAPLLTTLFCCADTSNTANDFSCTCGNNAQGRGKQGRSLSAGHFDCGVSKERSASWYCFRF